MAGKGHGGGSSGTFAYNGLLQQYEDGRSMGNVRYTHSPSGTNNDDNGRTPEYPYASIAYAISQVVADNHDLILAFPGHTETLTAAGTVTVDVAGLTIRGPGRRKARFNYTTAISASLDITAARTVIEGFYFTPVSFAGVTAAINVQAADVTIRDCEFELADATNQTALGILTTSAADRLVIERCHFHGTDDAGTNTAVRLVGGSDITIRDCWFDGAYDSGFGGIHNQATACNRVLVQRCVVKNRTAASTKAMVFDAGSSGILADNRLSILSGTAPVTGANFAWLGNYYSNALGAASTLL